MRFASDNRAGMLPEVVDALSAEATEFGGAYGEDSATAKLTALIAEIFEHDVAVYPVMTGTAANALILASLCEPWGGVACHEESHIVVDECGAPEFYGGGLRLVTLPGEHGRIEPSALDALLRSGVRGDVHQTPIQALSLTNLTEAGTTFDAAAIAELCGIARRHGLRTHLDGARFANAVVGTGETPADLTWRAGVDVMVFGGTKNGCLAAEAVVCFEPDLLPTFERRRKRGGHLASKMRFVSVQLAASLREDRWLTAARHANGHAARLAEQLVTIPAVDLMHPVEGNQVWISAPTAEIEVWERHGAEFYGSPLPGDGPPRSLVRLVASFATTDDDVTGFVELVTTAASTADAGPDSTSTAAVNQAASATSTQDCTGEKA